MTAPIEGSAIWTIPAIENPHAEAANASTLNWADRHEICIQQGERQNLKEIRPGSLAAYCHPEASAADLALIAQWMTWLFLLDDRIDESELGRNANLLEEHLQDIQGVALGNRTGTEPMSRALHEIVTQASAAMSDAWQLRFRYHVSEYLSACVWQAAHRQAAHVPQIGTFTLSRRSFGAIMPSFDLIEKTGGSALPPCVYYSRPYQDLLIAAADLVCWSNDLMTLDKEAALGDFHNLVLVTAYHRHQDLPTAEAEVSAACDRRVRTYLAKRQDLTQLTKALDLPDDVRINADHCATSLGVWARGHLEWGLQTPRYQTTTVPGN